MSELSELQQSFQQLVLEGDQDFKTHVTGDNEDLINTQIKIYEQAYRLRLKAVLRADFPGLHTIAGDQQFDTICEEYIQAYPSEHFSVRYFGREMQSFLKQTKPYSQHPVLEDMAAFEWTVGYALDAADADLFTLQELQLISPALWPDMTIQLHPSMTILPLRWNVAKFWQGVKEEQQLAAPEGYPNKVNWLIWRKTTEVYFRSLSDEEASVLMAVVEGKNFAQLCEGLCDWLDEDQVASRLVAFLQNWIDEQLVTGVNTKVSKKTL